MDCVVPNFTEISVETEMSNCQNYMWQTKSFLFIENKYQSFATFMILQTTSCLHSAKMSGLG